LTPTDTSFRQACPTPDPARPDPVSLPTAIGTCSGQYSYSSDIFPIYRKRETMFNFDWTKRTHKGLRRWILFILTDRPRTGVEIMDIMEGNLQGWWRPSPGSVYPLLESLVKEGLISKSPERKYSLTSQGREELEQGFPFFRGGSASAPRSVEGVLNELSSYVSYLEDVAAAKDGRLNGNAPLIKELGGRLAKLGESS